MNQHNNSMASKLRGELGGPFLERHNHHSTVTGMPAHLDSLYCASAIFSLVTSMKLYKANLTFDPIAGDIWFICLFFLVFVPDGAYKFAIVSVAL